MYTATPAQQSNSTPQPAMPRRLNGAEAFNLIQAALTRAAAALSLDSTQLSACMHVLFSLRTQPFPFNEGENLTLIPRYDNFQVCFMQYYVIPYLFDVDDTGTDIQPPYISPSIVTPPIRIGGRGLIPAEHVEITLMTSYRKQIIDLQDTLIKRRKLTDIPEEDPVSLDTKVKFLEMLHPRLIAEQQDLQKTQAQVKNQYQQEADIRTQTFAYWMTLPPQERLDYIEKIPALANNETEQMHVLNQLSVENYLAQDPYPYQRMGEPPQTAAQYASRHLAHLFLTKFPLSLLQSLHQSLSERDCLLKEEEKLRQQLSKEGAAYLKQCSIDVNKRMKAALSTPANANSEQLRAWISAMHEANQAEDLARSTGEIQGQKITPLLEETRIEARLLLCKLPKDMRLNSIEGTGVQLSESTRTAIKNDCTYPQPDQLFPEPPTDVLWSGVSMEELCKISTALISALRSIHSPLLDNSDNAIRLWARTVRVVSEHTPTQPPSIFGSLLRSASPTKRPSMPPRTQSL